MASMMQTIPPDTAMVAVAAAAERRWRCEMGTATP
jgi:hypothetical protein